MNKGSFTRLAPSSNFSVQVLSVKLSIRCTDCFAISYGNRVLYAGSRPLLDFDGLVPEYGANLRAGRYYDEGDMTTFTQLLGKGQPSTDYTDPLRDEVSALLLQYLARTDQQDWIGDDQDSHNELHLDVFSLAYKYGDEILWSLRHKRTRSR